jgi:hypothetical protein
MVYDNHLMLCDEFIQKLEKFVDAKQGIERERTLPLSDKLATAKFDLLSFVRKHFDLK